MTSFLYVINDLRKKKRQFGIGVSTIFLTVTVVTYLDCMIRLAPAVTMIASQSTVGDFDLQLQKRDAKDLIFSGNRNFYTDQLDGASQLQGGDGPGRGGHGGGKQVPYLNYTELNQTLSAFERGQAEVGNGHRVLGRFFPRWNAQSKVVDPRVTEGQKQRTTSAIMVAGNSRLENQIGVARGFPQLDL